MHCVRVRSGRTFENRAFPDRTEPDRHRQVASRSNGYEANSNDGGRNLQMVVVGSIAWGQAFLENGDLWRGDEGGL